MRISRFRISEMLKAYEQGSLKGSQRQEHNRDHEIIILTETKRLTADPTLSWDQARLPTSRATIVVSLKWTVVPAVQRLPITLQHSIIAAPLLPDDNSSVGKGLLLPHHPGKT